MMNNLPSEAFRKLNEMNHECVTMLVDSLAQQEDVPHLRNALEGGTPLGRPGGIQDGYISTVALRRFMSVVKLANRSCHGDPQSGYDLAVDWLRQTLSSGALTRGAIKDLIAEAIEHEDVRRIRLFAECGIDFFEIIKPDGVEKQDIELVGNICGFSPLLYAAYYGKEKTFEAMLPKDVSTFPGGSLRIKRKRSFAYALCADSDLKIDQVVSSFEILRARMSESNYQRQMTHIGDEVMGLVASAGEAISSARAYEMMFMLSCGAHFTDEKSSLSAILQCRVDLDLYNGGNFLDSLLSTICKEKNLGERPVSVVQRMIESGALPIDQDVRGSTLVQYAVIYRHSGLLSMLLDMGADPEQKTRSGLTCRELVDQAVAPDIAALLDAHAARRAMQTVLEAARNKLQPAPS